MKTRSEIGPVSTNDEKAVLPPVPLRGHSALKYTSLPQMLHFITWPSAPMGVRFRPFPFPVVRVFPFPLPLPKHTCSNSSPAMSARMEYREEARDFPLPPLLVRLPCFRCASGSVGRDVTVSSCGSSSGSWHVGMPRRGARQAAGGTSPAQVPVSRGHPPTSMCRCLFRYRQLGLRRRRRAVPMGLAPAEAAP